ncbi:MAG TPA: hypothetical protein VGI10_16420 [Polyangiaceae bacterium]
MAGEADRFPLSFTLTCLLLALGGAAFGIRRAYFGCFAGTTIVVVVVALAVNIAHSMRGSRSSLARQIVEMEAGMGDALRSVRWGICWAAAYTLPLGLLVWVIHR